MDRLFSISMNFKNVCRHLFSKCSMSFSAVSPTTDKPGEQRRCRHVSVFMHRRAATHPSSDSPRGREQGERAGWVNASQLGRMFTHCCRSLQCSQSHKGLCHVSTVLLAELKG